jgi:hypothetical protein
MSIAAQCCAIPASADEAHDALTKLLSSNTVDQSLFPDDFFKQYPLAPMQQILDQIRAQGGAFQGLQREGGAWIAHFANGSVPFEIVVNGRGRIIMIYALGFVPKSMPEPAGLADEVAIERLLAKVFQDPSVDLTLFEDASVAAKISNNRPVIVAGLGTFHGAFLAHGSYFARFDTMMLPIFVYVTQAKKIRGFVVYPPLPIKLVMAQP